MDQVNRKFKSKRVIKIKPTLIIINCNRMQEKKGVNINGKKIKIKRKERM